MALAGNMNIGKRSASGLTMNIAMNARSEIMPPSISHFQASAKQNSPIPNKVSCTMV
jgi:hypothetical protein